MTEGKSPSVRITPPRHDYQKVVVENLASEWDIELRLYPHQMDELCQMWMEMKNKDNNRQENPRE